jgi:uncharacterized protein YggE
MNARLIFSSLLLLALLSGCFTIQAAPQSPDVSGGRAGDQSPVAIQADEPARTISVSGDATVMVVPDEVVLTLGVETIDLNLAAAKRQNDEILRNVVAIARQYGLEDKHIQTDYINIEPRYENYVMSKFIGYNVRKSVVLTLSDIDQFEDLLSSLIDAKVTNVHGIEFRTTELRKYRDQARELALQAAREKAEAMAGKLEMTVLDPVSITENPSYWYSSYSSWWGGAGSTMTQNVIQNSGPQDTYQGDDALAPGQIAVRASVAVQFELR